MRRRLLNLLTGLSLLLCAAAVLLVIPRDRHTDTGHVRTPAAVVEAVARERLPRHKFDAASRAVDRFGADLAVQAAASGDLSDPDVQAIAVALGRKGDRRVEPALRRIAEGHGLWARMAAAALEQWEEPPSTAATTLPAT